MLPGEELSIMMISRERQIFTGKDDDFILIEIDMLLFFIKEQFYSGVDKNSAKDIKNPVEFLHDQSAGPDKSTSKDDGAQNAIEQNFVMIFIFQLKITKNQEHHKKIVERQHRLGDIGTHELRGHLFAHIQKHQEAKNDGGEYPEKILWDGRFETDPMTLAIQKTKVKHQEGPHDHGE